MEAADLPNTSSFNVVEEEDTASFVQVPLNDEENHPSRAATASQTSRKANKIVEKDKNDASRETLHRASVSFGHRRNSSRIGRIYRTSKEKGVHVATSSKHDVDTPRLEELEEEDATWGEVFTACCCHTPAGWVYVGAVMITILAVLYFFMVGLDLLSASFQVVSGCTAGSLLGADTNPLASVLIGIVATALLQSSSTTSSIVVAMSGAGLDVQAGIYIIMGANVGTCVTSILVSLSHMGDKEEIEAAFAGSSLYYLFNILSVVVLLPLEIGTQYLYRLTKAMLPSTVGSGDTWNSPIKAIVSPLTRNIIIANKNLVTDVSTGEEESCDVFYPVDCEGGVESYGTCRAGLIGCNKDNNSCPAFFQNGASKTDDLVSGYVCLILAVVILCLCLVGLVSLLRMVLLGASRRIVYKATKINGFLAILIGIGTTILVQSSSATTAALVPLAGIGVLRLEDMYPLCVGAGIGTTFTSLMAALVSSKLESLQIALAHLFFNLSGAVLWYPVPFMRQFVYVLARKLGHITRHWRGFPAVFVVVVFFLIPLLLLGISSCFEQGAKGFTALGTFIILSIVCAILVLWTWWRFRSGKTKCIKYLSNRRRRKAALDSIADDIDFVRVDVEYCKKEIARIKEFTDVPRLVRMEEGIFRPPMSTKPAQIDDAATELEEALSLYESCVSAPWTQVLVSAAGSIQDVVAQSRPQSPQQTTHARHESRMSASGRSIGQKEKQVHPHP